MERSSSLMVEFNRRRSFKGDSKWRLLRRANSTPHFRKFCRLSCRRCVDDDMYVGVKGFTFRVMRNNSVTLVKKCVICPRNFCSFRIVASVCCGKVFIIFAIFDAAYFFVYYESF
mmetsp:Transcript_20147/g.24915  ORF Transcript_20147/g.24915 Transcript_20147/m.24915 type:complete len:115 (+) Transcript_20147:267-611(+)